MKEWKEVYQSGNYKVSSEGEIKSFARYSDGRLLKPSKDKDGYLRVVLYVDGVKLYKRVNVLVAEAFIPNPNRLPMVNHIDNVVTHNWYKNLEWCDNQSNQLHSIRTRNNSNQKVVLQFTMKGELVGEFNSARDVHRVLGFDGSVISKVCRGERIQVYGFFQRFNTFSGITRNKGE